ncbi:hypothetical protein POM88_023447 [Heracleum sosnowskyi]|uniref:Uncharacterized protein n=1 Tax=Heracleum sosnowskyi TaxID=360622 RepID=A0AAD8MUY0_9APIA|nr:hypothetical protein POM88_023447 [Heracleum sosnowskyi]
MYLAIIAPPLLLTFGPVLTCRSRLRGKDGTTRGSDCYRCDRHFVSDRSSNSNSATSQTLCSLQWTTQRSLLGPQLRIHVFYFSLFCHYIFRSIPAIIIYYISVVGSLLIAESLNKIDDAPIAPSNMEFI